MERKQTGLHGVGVLFLRLLNVENVNVVLVLLGGSLYSKVVLLLKSSSSEGSLYIYSPVYCRMGHCETSLALSANLQC